MIIQHTAQRKLTVLLTFSPPLARTTIWIVILLPMLFSSCSGGLKKEYWENGKLKSEVSMNGALYEGPATWYYPNGNIQTNCSYHLNLLHGKMTRYFEDGKKQLEALYVEGKKNGVQVTWNEEGRMISRFSYSMDSLNGPFQEWHPNGRIKIKGAYRNGKYQGEWNYFNEDGMIVGKGVFNNGDGLQKAFYEDGSLRMEVPYLLNRKNGIETWYDIQGKTEKINEYKNGKMISSSTFK